MKIEAATLRDRQEHSIWIFPLYLSQELLQLLMVLVLLCLDIILQEDLNLWCHLWTNIFQEEAGDDRDSTEGKRCEGDVSAISLVIKSSAWR